VKILFLPKHEYMGASSRYRTLQYLSYLKEQNIDFDLKPLFSDAYLTYKYANGKENKLITIKRILKRIYVVLFEASKYDVLVIEKELIPYFPPILECYLKLRKIPYIVDYDDAVWHNYDNHKKAIVRFLFKNKIARVIKNAKSVIAGSEYIKDFALQFNDKVHKIPTVIDMKKYQCSTKKNDTDEFVVGWIGSPSTSNYIFHISEALKRFTDEYDGIVHLVGFDFKLSLEIRFNHNIISWSEMSEVEEICKFDVGIMPLPETPFERGKCGFKLIQYMGCKKPVIASPVGENNIIVEDGINGFLANDENEFYEQLKLFYTNRDNAKEFGITGFEKVNKLYSLQESQKIYLEVLKEGIVR